MDSTKTITIPIVYINPEHRWSTTELSAMTILLAVFIAIALYYCSGIREIHAERIETRQLARRPEAARRLLPMSSPYHPPLPGTPTTFPRFRDLPPELRLMIWKLAIPPGRLIMLRVPEIPVPEIPFPPRPGGWFSLPVRAIFQWWIVTRAEELTQILARGLVPRYWFSKLRPEFPSESRNQEPPEHRPHIFHSSTRPPALLHTCFESRQVALNYYRLGLAPDGYRTKRHSDSNPGSPQGRIYVNLERDILCYSDRLMGSLSARNLMRVTADVRKAKHVVIAVRNQYWQWGSQDGVDGTVNGVAVGMGGGRRRMRTQKRVKLDWLRLWWDVMWDVDTGPPPVDPSFVNPPGRDARDGIFAAISPGPAEREIMARQGIRSMVLHSAKEVCVVESSVLAQGGVSELVEKDWEQWVDRMGRRGRVDWVVRPPGEVGREWERWWLARWYFRELDLTWKGWVALLGRAVLGGDVGLPVPA